MVGEDRVRMIKVIVCDDEEYYRRRIVECITSYFKKNGILCEVDSCSSGNELIERKEQLSDYDIFFLDVNMENMDGIETAKKIRLLTQNKFIVFVTAFVTYSLEGYLVEAIRYIMKDDLCLDNAIGECLSTILNKMNYKEVKMRFIFQDKEREVILDNILFVESNLHKLIFHMQGMKADTYHMYSKLDIQEELLQKYGFCRIHKSFLVNLKYIEKLERYKAVLTTGTTLSVSKSRYKEAKNAITSYKGDI